MRCHVVVEGESDGRFIEQLLRRSYGPEQVRIVVAGGASAVTSSARTILATRREPVVVMVDADAVSDAVLANETNLVLARESAAHRFIACRRRRPGRGSCSVPERRERARARLFERARGRHAGCAEPARRHRR